MTLPPSRPSWRPSERQVPTSCLAGRPACGGRLSPHLPRVFREKQDAKQSEAMGSGLMSEPERCLSAEGKMETSQISSDRGCSAWQEPYLLHGVDLPSPAWGRDTTTAPSRSLPEGGTSLGLLLCLVLWTPHCPPGAGQFTCTELTRHGWWRAEGYWENTTLFTEGSWGSSWKPLIEMMSQCPAGCWGECRGAGVRLGCSTLHYKPSTGFQEVSIKTSPLHDVLKITKWRHSPGMYAFL